MTNQGINLRIVHSKTIFNLPEDIHIHTQNLEKLKRTAAQFPSKFVSAKSRDLENQISTGLIQVFTNADKGGEFFIDNIKIGMYKVILSQSERYEVNVEIGSRKVVINGISGEINHV